MAFAGSLALPYDPRLLAISRAAGPHTPVRINFRSWPRRPSPICSHQLEPFLRHSLVNFYIIATTYYKWDFGGGLLRVSYELISHPRWPLRMTVAIR